MRPAKRNGLALRQQSQALTSKPSTGKQADNIMNQILPDGASFALDLASRSVYAEWQSSNSRTGRELRRWLKRKQARAAK